MGWNDHIDWDNEDYKAFLHQLIDLGQIEDAALGITKLVIDKGVEALSPKQQHVFQKYVMDEHVIEDCKRCGASIPWSEKYEAKDNGNLCNYCDHNVSKEMARD